MQIGGDAIQAAPKLGWRCVFLVPADRSYLPIAGDSAPAKAAVTEFIDSIGYSVLDAGSVADSWRQATGTPVWGIPYGPYSNENGQPAGEDAIRAALATATR